MASFLASVVTKTVEQAAACTIYCAVAPELNGVGGRYFIDCRESAPSSCAVDLGTAERLWEFSSRLCGLNENTTKK
jgi:WW domain-containing oxidoreductase